MEEKDWKDVETSKYQKYIRMELKPVMVKIMKEMNRDCKENTADENNNPEMGHIERIRTLLNRKKESRRKSKAEGRRW